MFFRKVFLTRSQAPDTVATNQNSESRFSEDAERVANGSSPNNYVDPFQIRDGFVPEEELAGLRLRKRGKSIVQYQKQQNSVRASTHT